MNKETTVLSTIFIVSCMVLALWYSHTSGPRSIIQEDLQSRPVPVAPAPVTQPAGTDLLQGGGETQ
ncbi:MAG TPA: hypothetical protein VM123_02550 [archaeon]|nr:hypothetical protein [archaeon]